MGFAQVHDYLGLALMKTGRTKEAVEQFEIVTWLDLNYAPVLLPLRSALNRLRSTLANPQENPPTPDSFLFTSQDKKGFMRIEIGILGNMNDGRKK